MSKKIKFKAVMKKAEKLLKKLLQLDDEEIRKIINVFLSDKRISEIIKSHEKNYNDVSDISRKSDNVRTVNTGYNPNIPIYDAGACEKPPKSDATAEIQVTENKKSTEINTPANKIKNEVNPFAIAPHNVGSPAIMNTVDSAENYFRKMADISDLQDFVTENLKIDGFIAVRKKLDEYSEELEYSFAKIMDKIRKQIPENMISETAAKSAFSLLSEFFFNRLIVGIYERITYGSKGYDKLLEKVNAYLEKLEIYTYDFNVRAGGYISEKEAGYFNVIPAPTSQKPLSGTVCDVQILPYLMNYLSSSGEVIPRIHSGKVRVYEFVN